MISAGKSDFKSEVILGRGHLQYVNNTKLLQVTKYSFWEADIGGFPMNVLWAGGDIQRS